MISYSDCCTVAVPEVLHRSELSPMYSFKCTRVITNDVSDYISLLVITLI
jgi:hypothetical protein